MARDKLITIRIESEKREAFNQLAKSQNTDTASLLYDFINQCLDGEIDIKLVTGKGNRLDRIGNRIDTNRLDKLETTTQEIDNRLDTIAKKLTDSDQGLSEKMVSLEHRLNALAMQLDSQQDRQQDRQQIDTDKQQIDTDRQQNRQQENPDMEPLLKREKECSIASPLPTSPLSPGTDAIGTLPTVETVEPISTIETVASAIASIDGTVESVEPISSINELDTDAIGPVPGEGDSIGEPCKGMTAKDAVDYLNAKKVKISYYSLNRWISRKKIPDTSPQGKDALKHLILRDKLYFPKTDQP